MITPCYLTFMFALGSALLFAVSPDQAQVRSNAQFVAAEDSLKAFLQRYLRRPSGEDDKTTRYLDAFVDLNGDGIPEVIVYITGAGWCGSGGCNTLILVRNGSTYSVLTEITITRRPIRVLASRAPSGWRDLGVWVQGGGIQPGYEAALRFDGKSYPTNPSTPPARRSAGQVSGKSVVPSSASAKPLYP